ncbi:hypothetical protein Vi05172_g11978 [Venturia inaequalis]|uniref:FAD synthase n=1 Tax=Venturia inaequalis TaxID=5025 RepID=A0A8H3ZGQ2_VENIN|nr:hypothetical protein EG327_007949 [Venturia inaequalis]RDI78025.1 hypothetical protein Vi05172_g11978 [Venturia inaequalis]
MPDPTPPNARPDASSPFTDPLLPSGEINLPDLCRRINQRITDFLVKDAETEALRSVQKHTRIALGVIEEALKKYSLTSLSLSYNGGKDCLVLLILYLAALHNHQPSPTTPLQSVYIVSSHPFPEVEDFVNTSSATCSLQLSRYNMSMKPAFTAYLQEHKEVEAIFVGTRRTDPHGEFLTHFDRTDHGWPDFMRVHPVIDWHYVDIWNFIIHLQIPYCPLYDQGYTSLGGTTDTHPNPALRRQSVSESGTSKVIFRPAYELMADNEERLGRDWERKGAPPPASEVTIGSTEEPVVDGEVGKSL